MTVYSILVAAGVDSKAFNEGMKRAHAAICSPPLLTNFWVVRETDEHTVTIRSRSDSWSAQDPEGPKLILPREEWEMMGSPERVVVSYRPGTDADYDPSHPAFDGLRL